MTRTTKEMRLVYRDFLKDHSHPDQKLAVLEADLSSSMATNKLAEDFGKRYVNVGIMEAEMVGVAAGLSVLGYKPYLHTFGPFASRRVYDQVFLSLGYAQLDATIIGSDAGVSAEMNGGTHMPFEEIGLMRLIPKATVFEASDDLQFQAILEQTLDIKGLKYVRTIRKAPPAIYNGEEDFSKGYYQLREGKDLTIVASGIMVAEALTAADLLSEKGISVSVIDLFRIKPLPDGFSDLLSERPVLTAENHNQTGGIGSAISELLSGDTQTPVYRIGVAERFGQVGQMPFLMEEYGLTADHIAKKATEILS
ncbi:transketolase family protein [Streptococcus cameli]